MRISFVVAVARNGVIGRGGGLAWKISDDLKQFRSLTIGKPVIMGRKTYVSIGKPLAGRINIVVSRTMKPKDGVLVARTIEEATALGEKAAADLGAGEICVIGGADIFAMMMPLADRIYLTEVAAEVEGDVYFPPFDPAVWKKRMTGGAAASRRNEYNCNYFILDRR